MKRLSFRKKCFVVLLACLLITLPIFYQRYSQYRMYCNRELAFARQYLGIIYSEEEKCWYNYGYWIGLWEDFKKTQGDFTAASELSVAVDSKEFTPGRGMVVSVTVENQMDVPLDIYVFLIQYLDGKWYMTQIGGILKFEYAVAEAGGTGYETAFLPEILPGYMERSAEEMETPARFYGCFRAVVMAKESSWSIGPFSYYALSRPFWILPKDYENKE